MNQFKCRKLGSVKRCPGLRRLNKINRIKLLCEGAGFRTVSKVIGVKTRSSYLEQRRLLSIDPQPVGNRPIPIVAVDDDGNVVARYPSAKSTTEHGYNSTCVSNAITRGCRYRGLYWRKETTRAPCL